MYTHTFL